jgi:ATP-dependent DNA ligase
MMLPPLEPMLAVSAAPFDSPEYSFEIKWNGIRALAAVEATGWRLWGRERADYTARYPELAVLHRLPAGTLLDGELVAFTPEGRPELPRLLRRHGLTAAWRLGQARRWCPVQYVVFDLLYHRGRCWPATRWPGGGRSWPRLCAGLDLPEVVFSAGVVGAGTTLYALALTQGQEGVVAKHLASPYRPGRRSPAWRKIKPGGRANRLEG